MGVLQTYAGNALAYIKEILHREIIVLGRKPTELAHLSQQFVHYVSIGRESHLVYFLLPQGALALGLQQPSNLIESELALKVIWINHGCKISKNRAEIGKNAIFL